TAAVSIYSALFRKRVNDRCRERLELAKILVIKLANIYIYLLKGGFKMLVKQKKAIITMLSAMLVMSTVAACTSNNGKTNTPATPKPTAATTTNNTAEGGETTTGIDTSKKVELQFYMLGNAPKDLPQVEKQVNEWLLEDLNATVKFNYTTWT